MLPPEMFNCIHHTTACRFISFGIFFSPSELEKQCGHYKMPMEETSSVVTKVYLLSIALYVVNFIYYFSQDRSLLILPKLGLALGFKRLSSLNPPNSWGYRCMHAPCLALFHSFMTVLRSPWANTTPS